MTVILPGSYDPVTVGHLEIIKKAAREYDGVYVVVFNNPSKKYRFSTEDRVRMLAIATDSIDNVIVSYSDGLVIDYMREHGIDLIVKGYRNDEDLKWEKYQADWNFSHGGYETRLIKCDSGMESISSTAARRMLDSDDTCDGILTKEVEQYIKSLSTDSFSR